MMLQVQRMPIIHTAALQVLVGNRKAQGVNQVQTTPRDRTEATDITGILRDLGIEQDDVKHGVYLADNRLKVDSEPPVGA